SERSLTLNDWVRGQGNSREMIAPIVPLICYMSRFVTLRAGDIILTGTRQGGGPMNSGDMLKITLNGKSLTTRVI
ncbi:fumarylacetoacetate hydrolase family protein, partial [Serratia quinivorans]